MRAVNMTDCNACNYNAWNVDKILKKKACEAVATTFKGIMEIVIGYCNNYSGRLDKRKEIEQAKELLIKHTNHFTHDKFDHVEIRWCKINQKFGGYDFRATGMVPEQNKILLDVGVKDANTQDLAVLIAHEMKHIEQYREWGTGKFRCEYMDELASGHGFGRDNKVEREAYDFEDKISGEIHHYIYDL